MRDLEKQPDNPNDSDAQKEATELRALYQEVLGEDNRYLLEDREEASELIVTLGLMVSDGFLGKDMTLDEVLNALKRRRRELSEEIGEIARAKSKIELGGKL